MIPPPEHDEERVAIITGASQGIGAGLARAYRRARVCGGRLALDRRDFGDPGVLTVEGDIAEPDTAQRIVQAAVEHFGRIDTLVNNAGIYIGKPFTDYTLDDFDAMIAVNLAGFFHITQRVDPTDARPGPRARRQRHNDPRRPRRTARDQPRWRPLTKGGLAAVTRSLAIEYASRGMRVNAVALGVIKTPLHDAASYAGLAALHPLGRVGEVSDVVDGILYLERAPFVTGEILHIDGGQAAGH